jgi:methionine-rich copper-binding protein CopC
MLKLRLLTAFAFAVAVALQAWLIPSALAHGTYVSSDPAAHSKVAEPPAEVTITLSEKPAPGSTVSVVDGCNSDVAVNVKESGDDLVVALDPGQPGLWDVSFKSISAEDGHEVEDDFTFVVKGQKDCAAAANESPSTSSRPPITNDDEGSSFPVVPLAIGTIVVVGGALLLRRGSSGS